jgi:glutathione peroxidase
MKILVFNRGVRMSIFDIEVKSIDGQTQTLEPYRGRVLLIVNVASKCMFTGQYTGLESLYKRYKEKGLTILGFPCNQFGKQEPGDEASIKNFCSLNYNVTFPMFAKIDVNGDSAHPLYRFLKSQKAGLLWSRSIKWNFTKFLVGKDGTVLKRYGPAASEKQIERDLMLLLERPDAS